MRRIQICMVFQLLHLKMQKLNIEQPSQDFCNETLLEKKNSYLRSCLPIWTVVGGKPLKKEFACLGAKSFLFK